MTFFKRFLSFFYPIKEFVTSSEINTSLEVTWNNGKLVLDSKNANFSFGSLERVMRFGLKKIGKEKISKMNHALILGIGGGSVISLLKYEFNFRGSITGIERDNLVLTVAEKYFNLRTTANVRLVHADALEYVKGNKEKYNLIIVDIFEDATMPNFLFTEDFVKHLKTLLEINGYIFFNTIVSLESDSQRNHIFENLLKQNFNSVKKYSEIEGINEIFILCP